MTTFSYIVGHLACSQKVDKDRVHVEFSHMSFLKPILDKIKEYVDGEVIKQEQ